MVETCPTGESCSAGVCTAPTGSCGPSSCTGCCVGTSCLAYPSQSASACGQSGASCQACQNGYTCGSGSCTDVDECATNNGGCDLHADCTNTMGSHLCTCRPGYTGNGAVCTVAPDGGVSGWVLATSNKAESPPARREGALAYHAASGTVVLFGGEGLGGIDLDDTWKWNGLQWTKVSGAGPPARRAAVLVHDTARDKDVLFGGFAGTDTLNDTWEFDGTSWRKLDVVSPTPRGHAAAAYDPVRRRIVVFGGNLEGLATIRADTWEFGETFWEPVSSALTPEARYGASMVYQPATSSVLMFGGITNSSGASAQLWSWDGSNWLLVSNTGPDPRAGAALGVMGTRLVLFGGFNSSYEFGDTWERTTDWYRATGFGPTHRSYAAHAVDVVRQKLVVFSGQGAGGALLTQTWEYAPDGSSVHARGALSGRRTPRSTPRARRRRPTK